MITLDRLLNVTIYLGGFLLFISFITFVIKRGPDLLFFNLEFLYFLELKL
ncbi:hypothetical protein BTT_46080 [Bacillus thuringiensis serovar morrisoni str. 4AA1]|nr:hypothetical protein BTT_46080 [Bacillus thuringiensis serovar morrisoni str. 4AA1]